MIPGKLRTLIENAFHKSFNISILNKSEEENLKVISILNSLKKTNSNYTMLRSHFDKNLFKMFLTIKLVKMYVPIVQRSPSVFSKRFDNFNQLLTK